MTLHIGIVACSAEGAALCYRTICHEGAQLMGTHDHPEVTMHTHSLAESMRCIGLEYVLPNVAERAEINRIIFEELVCGVFKDEAVTYFQQVMQRMKSEGCDAVVLGCTEIPLIMNDASSPLPTLDSTRLLARSALRRAISS